MQRDGEAAMSSAHRRQLPGERRLLLPSVPIDSPSRSPSPGAGAGAGGDLEEDDEDMLITISAVDDIERGYSEAKRRAPPCVCRRGECAVRRDERSGRWMYVCSSQPKCKYVALCEEVCLSPESQPAVRSHPKPSNPCVFNIPSNHVPEPRTPINNVNIRGAGSSTPINVSPQAAICKTPLSSTFQVAGTTSPVNVSPKGAGATAEWPTCLCTAGKCKILSVRGKDHYVCRIPKGQGACTNEVPVHVPAIANDLLQTGDDNTRGDKDLKDKPAEKEAHGNNNLVQVGDKNANGSVNPSQAEDSEWPFDIINNGIVPTAQATPRTEVGQGSPSMLRQQIAMETPTKSPMPPYSTRSPITPRSDNICFGCGEKGHWIRDCPKPKPCPRNDGCFNCGMAGHWRSNCPQLRGSQKHVVN